LRSIKENSALPISVSRSLMPQAAVTLCVMFESSSGATV
jgi:hypothetical protein